MAEAAQADIFPTIVYAGEAELSACQFSAGAEVQSLELLVGMRLAAIRVQTLGRGPSAMSEKVAPLVAFLLPREILQLLDSFPTLFVIGSAAGHHEI